MCRNGRTLHKMAVLLPASLSSNLRNLNKGTLIVGHPFPNMYSELGSQILRTSWNPCIKPYLWFPRPSRKGCQNRIDYSRTKNLLGHGQGFRSFPDCAMVGPPLRKNKGKRGDRLEICPNMPPLRCVRISIGQSPKIV